MSSQKKELVKFNLIMLIFMAGMVVMIVKHIHEWWIWAIYISAWTYIEAGVAKNFHLKWWVWVLIIGGLCVVDLLVIALIS